MQMSNNIEGDGMDVLSAADLFATQVDANGYMPGDDGYEEDAVDPDYEDPIDYTEEEEEEDEPEGDEAEEDEESDEEADTKGKDEEDEGELFEIEIDGEAYEVNAEELKAGYLRNEQYVGRVTKLEAEYQEKESELGQKELQIENELNALLNLQHSELQRFKNVNWQELRVVDPDQYKELRVQYHEANERAQLFNARKQELNQHRQEADKIKHQAYLQSQQALAAKLVPEFSDPGFQKELIKFGEEIGYSEAELRNIADARHLMLINQARLYAKSQLKRKEALEKKVPKEVPKTLKPGATKAVSGPNPKAMQRAAAGLKNTGSINAARDYFLTAGLI